MSVEQVLFWAFGTCIVVGAAGVISARNAVNSAMALVATFFFLAGIYLLLWAPSLAVLQVLVYAGAIMVLFLFVIILLYSQYLLPFEVVSLLLLVAIVGAVVVAKSRI